MGEIILFAVTVLLPCVGIILLQHHDWNKDVDSFRGTGEATSGLFDF